MRENKGNGLELSGPGGEALRGGPERVQGAWPGPQ